MAESAYEALIGERMWIPAMTPLDAVRNVERHLRDTGVIVGREWA
jgi:hypothetical protein